MRTIVRLAAAVFVLAAAPSVAQEAAKAVAEAADEHAARVLETRVDRVTVYSDRARITRAARVKLEPGRQRVEVPDLPFGLDDGSVSAALPGARNAKILAIEVEKSFGKRASKKEAEALLKKREELVAKQNRLQDEVNALGAEESVLRSFSVKAPTNEKGQPEPVPLEPANWRATLSFVQGGLESVLARKRDKVAEQQALQKELSALDVEIRKIRSYEQEAVKRVVLELDADGATTADVEVTYAIAGPHWRPAYDVRVLSASGKIELVTYAVVRQETGEDWADASVTFSTAFPEGGADLPELLAWRLGDTQQYAYAAGQGGVGQMSPGIAVAQTSRTEHDGAKSQRADRRAPSPSRSARAEAPSAPPPMAAPAPAMEAPSDDYGSYDEEELADSIALESTGSIGGMPVGNARAKKEEAKPAPQYAANRQQAQIEAVGSGIWKLPAGRPYVFHNREAKGFAWSGDVLYCPSPRVAAGGFDFKFKPKRRQTIPSDGRERKVKLAEGTFAADLLYEIVAPVSTKAYLRADLKNDRKQPFLAGESFVFLDDDFVGRAFLDTVAPGESMTLSLGVDEDVKVERRVEQTAETQGLISKKERTVYTVLLTVKSFEKRAIEVIVRDQMPITWQKDDISIDGLKVLPEPSKPDEALGTDPGAGLLAWKLKIPAGGKQDFKIQYAVERPRDFDLMERRQ